MRFIADDGKIFNTIDECEEYEKVQNQGKEIAIVLNNYVTIYDEHGQELTPTTNWEDNISDYLDIIAKFITYESYFIKIDTDNDVWEKVYNYFYNEYGVYLPHFCGLWRYSLDDHEWIEFKKDYDNFKKMWAPMGIFE